MTAEPTVDAHGPQPTAPVPYAAVPAVPAVPAAVLPPPATRGGALKRLLVPAGVLGAVVGAFAYVGSVDPNEPGHYPVCPFLQLTGVLCPGCGGLRSAHAFVHGDFLTALQANAVAVAGYLLFAVGWVVWAYAAARGRQLRLRLPSAYAWGIGGLLLVFTVVRNLPFGAAWLSP
ncbi:DUF2752 domain-containing protein [Streptomyces sp. NPDC002851]